LNFLLLAGAGVGSSASSFSLFADEGTMAQVAQ
jgi:hypothetical protein